MSKPSKPPKFKNSHNLEIYVIPMLKNLGYNEKDIVYVHANKGGGLEYPIPDYIIKDKIAVEVGNLTEEDKILDLLKEYEKVIWIFSDENLPFLNCIIYSNKGEFRTKTGKIIKDQHEKQKQLIIKKYDKKIEELKFSLELKDREIGGLVNKNNTMRNKLGIINELVEKRSDGGEEGFYEYYIKSELLEPQ